MRNTINQTGFNTLFFYAGLLLALLFLTTRAYAASYDGNRWYLIEVSIFTNESQSDREEEFWSAELVDFRLPGNARTLTELTDILTPSSDYFDTNDAAVIEIIDLSYPVIPGLDPAIVGSRQISQDASFTGTQSDRSAIANVAEDDARSPGQRPPPRKPRSDFHFIDMDRDPFVQLPPSASDFNQTNRAIERSSNHRLLFHGTWRQPVLSSRDAVPIAILAGEKFDDDFELSGYITVRFNDNQDRVMLDTDLLLAEFTLDETPDPQQPGANQDQFEIEDFSFSLEPEFMVEKIFRHKQSRAMRSDEFHYLDHPALGVIVMVQPIEIGDSSPELNAAEEPALAPGINGFNN